MRAREPIPPHVWAGFLLAAVLINGLSLMQAGDALGNALAAEDDHEAEPDVMEFDVIDEREEEPELVDPDEFDDRLAETDRRAERDANPTAESKLPNRDPGPQPQPDGPATDGRAVEPSEVDSPIASPGEFDPSVHEAPDGGQATGGTFNPAALGGSPASLHSAFGNRGTRHDVEDVDEGELSVLKAKRNLYASFFNRMKDRVSEHWEPEDANKAADPHQKRFGTASRTTVLWVQLDEQGAVIKIVVKQKSGADHLDEEAIRALKAAAPFPNPPDELIDGSGRIEFDFGFTLDFVEGPRIFRSK